MAKATADAVRQRDVRLGQIRQLEDEATRNKGSQGAGRVLELSHESATEWRDMREPTDASPALDFVLADKLERAEVDGQCEEARRFANFVFRGAIPLSKAMEEYLEERSEGNSFGYDPLATTTALNVRSTMNHLMTFLGGDLPTMQDVTRNKAFEFRANYLPVIVGLKPPTLQSSLL